MIGSNVGQLGMVQKAVGSITPAPPSSFLLIMESGGALLLESGDKLLLEAA